MKTLLTAAVLLLAVHGAMAAPETVSVGGTFVDRYTGRGVPRAEVTLEQRHWGFPMEAAGTFLASTTTDAKGNFRLVGPWRGKMRISCDSRRARRSGTLQIEGAARDLRVLSSVEILRDDRFLVPPARPSG